MAKTVRRTRADELRARGRKLDACGFAIAALVYWLVLFVWAPEFRVEPWGVSEVQLRFTEQVELSPMFMEVLFGPPGIVTSDGTVQEEPADRVLEIGRVLVLPSECLPLISPGREAASGLVQLHVQAAGWTYGVELTRSTGDDCGDEAITAVANALRYRWLPDDRFPAPVELIQPITLQEVRN